MIDKCHEIWWFFIALQTDVLSALFKAIPGKFQFIFALLLPVHKELNKVPLSKLVTKMAFDVIVGPSVDTNNFLYK